MKAAFIVTLNLTNGETKQDVAEDLKDLVASDGYSVISVEAWASPGEAQQQASSLSLLSDSLGGLFSGASTQDDGTVTAG